MGQDFSWPCSSRKEDRKNARKRYVEEDNAGDDYDYSVYANYSEYDDDDNRYQNTYSKEYIDNDNDKDYEPTLKKAPLKPIKSNRLMISSSSLQRQKKTNEMMDDDGDIPSPFSFPDESDISTVDMSRFQVLCQGISNFPSFAEKQTKFTNYRLIPSYIIPHVDKERAIVIMQAVDDIEFVVSQSQKMHRYISITMDIKGSRSSTSYQYFRKLLLDASSKGLIYIGYYLQSSTKYVFCFYEPADLSHGDKWLEFEALEFVTENEIKKKIEQQNKSGSKFKGMISIQDDESTLRRHLCFLIFEKQPLNKQSFFIVPYPNDLLETDNFQAELTEKIEIHCGDSEINLAGLISNPETKELYIVFSK